MNWKRLRIISLRLVPWPVLGLAVLFLTAGVLYGAEEDLKLNDLIQEGLKNSPEILASQSRSQAADHRIPQAKALPDPMFMFGYQNESFNKITLGEAENAMGMFTLSQQFLFPGKQGLKGEMAARDAENLAALYETARLRVTAQIKTVFYDLFFAYRNIDILKDRLELFNRIEEAAASRYASGMGSQQEVLMAQTEKYMISEKEEMQRQKVQALQGMLNTVVGREVNAPLARPGRLTPTPMEVNLERMLSTASSSSPALKARRKMLEGAEAKVRFAERDYYPDFTLAAGYFPRGGLEPMWNLTATVNLAVYFSSKQKQAFLEAKAGLSEAKQELQAAELMLASSIRENFSMLQSADRLMKLYKEGVLPKSNQDVQLAFSGYVSGKVEALTVITRIKNLLEVDILYWNQFVEREKAIARLEALMGVNGVPNGTGSVVKALPNKEAR